MMMKSVEHGKTTPSGVLARIKNILLFLASPFIGLVYAVLLPGKLLQLAMAERKEAKQVPSAKPR